MQNVGHHEYFSGLEREVTPPGVVHIVNACTGPYRVKGRRKKRWCRDIDVHMLAHNITPLINKSADRPPNYRKTARTFSLMFSTPSFNEQAEPVKRFCVASEHTETIV